MLLLSIFMYGGLAVLLASAQEAARERLTQRIAQLAQREAEDDDGEPWAPVVKAT